MIRLIWLSRTEKWLKRISIWCGILIAGSAALLKFDGNTGPNFLGLPENSFARHVLGDILNLNISIAWWLIPLLTLFGSLAAYFKTHFGSRSIWATVNTLIEEYRKSLFERRVGFESRPNHFERVTLYKYRRFRFGLCFWPWGGWMIPVARTGVATVRRNIPRFRCPMAHPERAEGVAGQTFATNVKVPAPDLPEIGLTSSEDDIEKYAKKGFVSKEWVKKRRICASRSLLGVPIEVRSEAWGVIVIDSTEPEEIVIDDEQGRREFRILSKLLAKLLES